MLKVITNDGGPGKGWPTRKNYANSGGVYVHNGKSMALGGGGRFAALKGKLAKEPGITNPGALAASINRKKYGTKKFTALGNK
jgi:hypothetical protein